MTVACVSNEVRLQRIATVQTIVHDGLERVQAAMVFVSAGDCAGPKSFLTWV